VLRLFFVLLIFMNWLVGVLNEDDVGEEWVILGGGGLFRVVVMGGGRWYLGYFGLKL